VGALLCGYAAFSRLRPRRAREPQAPGAQGDVEQAPPKAEQVSAARRTLKPRTDVGALFLARATDSLSPFGAHYGEAFDSHEKVPVARTQSERVPLSTTRRKPAKAG
jgi:hypothetical protein